MPNVSCLETADDENILVLTEKIQLNSSMLFFFFFYYYFSFCETFSDVGKRCVVKHTIWLEIFSR